MEELPPSLQSPSSDTEASLRILTILMQDVVLGEEEEELVTVLVVGLTSTRAVLAVDDAVAVAVAVGTSRADAATCALCVAAAGDKSLV